MTEDDQRNLSSEEKIYNKITELKKKTSNNAINWNVVNPQNIVEKKDIIVDNLNNYDFISEAYKLEKNNNIIYVGKKVTSYMDENDEIKRDFDFFITFSDMNSLVLTTYTDSELTSEMRANNFSYAVAINSVIGGKKKVYSSEIYRLIKEIKMQFLDI